MPTDTQDYHGIGGVASSSGVFHITSSFVTLSGAKGPSFLQCCRDFGEEYGLASGQTVAGGDVTFELRGRPRVIDGFTLRFTSSASAASEAWKFQGSHDGVSWDDLHAFSFDPTLTGVTRNNLGGGNYNIVATFANTTEYQYYRMLGTGGTTTAIKWWGMTFRMQANELEAGDRGSDITFSTNMTFTDSTDRLLDGDNSSLTTRTPFSSSPTGYYMRFQFPESVCVTQAYFQALDITAQSMGTWKWQGSNDGSSWTDLSSPFTWYSARGDDTEGGSHHTLTNEDEYFYYQLICTGGTCFDKRFFEVMFNIVAGGGGEPAVTSQPVIIITQ